MKIFEIDGKKIRIPENLTEITVKELIELHKAGELKGSLDDITRLIEIFNGRIDISKAPLDTVIQISMVLSETLFTSGNIVPYDSFTFDGKEYKVLPPEELLVREFIDFQDMSNEPVANLPLLLAIVCQYEGEDVPDDEKGYIEFIGRKRDLFNNLDAKTAQGCLLFFSNAFTGYALNTLEYLETIPELQGKLTEIKRMME